MMPQPEAERQETIESEIEMLRKSLAEEKAKAETYLAGWQRAQADFINYKRRGEQEKEDTIRYANGEFIRRILPVVDDFERAFATIPADQANDGWRQGMKMVERKLKAFLEGQELSEIKALGEKFDPNVHEAVMPGEGEEGVVVKEFQKGYKLGDRVIRPAKVVVGSGIKKEEKEA